MWGPQQTITEESVDGVWQLSGHSYDWLISRGSLMTPCAPRMMASNGVHNAVVSKHIYTHRYNVCVYVPGSHLREGDGGF